MGSRKILLLGIHPPIEGQRWESESPLSIGRSPSSEIVLDHPSVSRHHAEVVPTDVGWVVRDLKSQNGTFVNGVGLSSEDCELRLNDIVQLGKLVLKVAAIEGQQPASPPIAQAQERPPAFGEAELKIEATAKRSWEKALESLANVDEQQLPQGKHFLTLLRAGYHFCNVTAMEPMLQSILDDTVAVLKAQRGTILLTDERTGQLRPYTRSATRRYLREGKAFSATLIKRCFEQGESLLCRDVNADPELLAASSVQQGTMASIICALFRSPKKRLGVLHLDRGPLQPAFTEEEFYLADAIAATVSMSIETAQLIQAQSAGIIQALSMLAQTVETRVEYLAGHAGRVADYALLLGSVLQIPDADAADLELGAALHNIGMTAVADSVLHKPGPLSETETERVRAHAAAGAALIASLPSLAGPAAIVRSHHERWDGQGYPDGVAGDSIPQLARMVAVADAFDAMTTARPYRPALSAQQAFQQLQEQAGHQFDPACIHAFLTLRPRLESMLAAAGIPHSGGVRPKTT